MRDEDVVGVAAVPCHAEVLPGRAVVVAAGFTVVALSAADPGVDQPDVTDVDTDDVGTDLFDDSHHLVAHDHRVGDATIGEAKFASAAEVVATVTQMRVGVAHPALGHSQQNLRPCGSRRR